MLNAIDIATAALLADSGITALVGRRVWPVIAPQDSALPNIVVTQISEIDVNHMSGNSGRLPESRISIVSRGTTATEMMNLADTVKIALRDIQHQSIGGSPDVTIQKASTDVTQFFDEPPVFEQTADYRIRWRSP